ncbi:TPA: hypothetical protein ACSTJ0_004200 [Serratia fonticola]|uniref:hypothetical protein n=1 Tax=Serratia fonticola TaxID=47917 RepID=UPI0021791081|nr:hypothetical protein [Serratia fonticola]CAI1158908.1 Uncharacterised protein [Serratia fonticola]CAI2496778.1 Uncharacterised protein [Serratia fonticola]
MHDHQAIKLTLISAARKQGFTLEGKDLLDLRTSVAVSLAAKERHKQRMSAPAYQWKKPAPKR